MSCLLLFDVIFCFMFIFLDGVCFFSFLSMLLFTVLDASFLIETSTRISPI